MESLCSERSKFFFIDLKSIDNGGKNENGRVDSPKRVSFHFESSGVWVHFFPPMVLKRDDFHDFLFVYLRDEVFQKCGLLLEEGICINGSKFFRLRDAPHFYIWESTMKLTEMFLLKVYPFT